MNESEQKRGLYNTSITWAGDDRQDRRKQQQLVLLIMKRYEHLLFDSLCKSEIGISKKVF